MPRCRQCAAYRCSQVRTAPQTATWARTCGSRFGQTLTNSRRSGYNSLQFGNTAATMRSSPCRRSGKVHDRRSRLEGDHAGPSFRAGLGRHRGERLAEPLLGCRHRGEQRGVLPASEEDLDGWHVLEKIGVRCRSRSLGTPREDPTAFVLSANIHRRHITKGQHAMAVAMIHPGSASREPMRRGELMTYPLEHDAPTN